MPLIGARIAEGIAGGQVNARLLELQQALADLARQRQEQQQQQQFQQSLERLEFAQGLRDQSALEALATQLGVEADPEVVRAARAQQIAEDEEREDLLFAQQQEDRARAIEREEERSALSRLRGAMEMGEFYGNIPVTRDAQGRRRGTVVPMEVEEALPGTSRFATQVRRANQAATQPELFDDVFIRQTSPEGAEVILQDPRLTAQMSPETRLKFIARTHDRQPEDPVTLKDAQDDLMTFINLTVKQQFPLGIDFPLESDQEAMRDAINAGLQDPQFRATFAEEHGGITVDQAMPGGRQMLETADITQALMSDDAVVTQQPTAPGPADDVAQARSAQGQDLFARSQQLITTTAGGAREVANNLRTFADQIETNPDLAAQSGYPNLSADDIRRIADLIDPGGLP